MKLKWGEKKKNKKKPQTKPPKQNCKRQPRRRLSIFKCVWECVSIFRWVCSLRRPKDTPATDHCSSNTNSSNTNSSNSNTSNCNIAASTSTQQQQLFISFFTRRMPKKKKQPNCKRLWIENQIEEIGTKTMPNGW